MFAGCYKHQVTNETQTKKNVFYGCKTLSLTLMEERKLRVFENRVLFGPKREEVAGGC